MPEPTTREEAVACLRTLHDDIRKADTVFMEVAKNFEQCARPFNAAAEAGSPNAHDYMVGYMYARLRARAMALLTQWAELHKALFDLGVPCSGEDDSRAAQVEEWQDTIGG